VPWTTQRSTAPRSRGAYRPCERARERRRRQATRGVRAPPSHDARSDLLPRVGAGATARLDWPPGASAQPRRGWDHRCRLLVSAFVLARSLRNTPTPSLLERFISLSPEEYSLWDCYQCIAWPPFILFLNRIVFAGVVSACDALLLRLVFTWSTSTAQPEVMTA
jgi:hypothetical protein